MKNPCSVETENTLSYEVKQINDSSNDLGLQLMLVAIDVWFANSVRARLGAKSVRSWVLRVFVLSTSKHISGLHIESKGVWFTVDTGDR